MSLHENVGTERSRSKKPKNLSELLLSLHKRYPKWDKDRLIAAFQDQVRDELAYTDEASECWARLNYSKLLETPAPRKKAPDQTVKIKGLMVGNLLNLIAPNGKKLGDCTGAECRSFSGWYERLADRVRPNQKVRDVLTDKDIRAL